MFTALYWRGLLRYLAKDRTEKNAQTGEADRTSSSAIEVPSHTQFYVDFDQTLDSAKIHQGDVVTGVLHSPIVAGGRDLFPKGTKLDVRVTKFKDSQQGRERRSADSERGEHSRWRWRNTM